MVSVIIPTMWLCHRLHETLRELNECKHVKEVILIDNTKNTDPVELEKVIHVLEGKNTYVGPAWNKGVNLAKGDKLLIINDDTWFDWSILGTLEKFVTKEVGMIGISKENYNTTEKNPKLAPVNNLPYGFGCAFFIHKENWVSIPEDIRIFSTDTWQFAKNKHRGNYTIKGLPVSGHISKSVNHMRKKQRKEFYKVIKEDLGCKEKYGLS